MWFRYQKFYKSKKKNKFCKKNNWKVDENIILFIGRINKHKGIFLLLEAFKILIDNNYKCNLLIVGNDEIYFKNLLEKLTQSTKKVLIFNHKMILIIIILCLLFFVYQVIERVLYVSY